MVRIHGLAYMIVGTAVSAYSYIVGNEKLKLFFWVGIAFAVFGVIRLVTDKINKPNVNNKNHHMVHHQNRFASKFCSYCGSALHDVQNFCHNCGQRTIHK